MVIPITKNKVNLLFDSLKSPQMKSTPLGMENR